MGHRPGNWCGAMVSQTNPIDGAAEHILDALQNYFSERRVPGDIHVSLTQHGYLSILLVSDVFKGMSPFKRQDEIWQHLKDRVDYTCLSYLTRIHPVEKAENGGFGNYGDKDTIDANIGS